ncbi:hypothetical protein C2E15_12355 [Mixta gaviniae]|uniref:Uncharacterized protein n=1 Tax=Mixta gaviniae TaxID=665914 RepID=A0A2L0IH05_9GAMM|nr:hypothetical protein C2E15_12355 [Mixta gaviniae]
MRAARDRLTAEAHQKKVKMAGVTLFKQAANDHQKQIKNPLYPGPVPNWRDQAEGCYSIRKRQRDRQRDRETERQRA